MKTHTLLTLVATLAIAGSTYAADRPERPEPTRPDVSGSTSDEVVSRPARPEKPDVTKPEIERPEVPADVKKAAAKVVRHTRAELDRIKEALKRLRENNRDLTDEQVERIKEKLLERAKAVVARAKSAKERIEDLKPRLGNRDELLEKAREKRDERQTAAKAATGRDRE